MKLQPVNLAKHNNNNTNVDNNNNSKKSYPSFGSASLAGLAGFIENNGFMGEFLTNDIFGMMGPRIVQGYGRNSEELGHLNYKAGREEAVREMLSGPAYFYVPIAVIGATAALMGRCAKVSAAVLDSFKPIMHKVGAGFKDTNINEKFINSLADDAFGGYTKETDKITKIKQALMDVVTEKISVKKAKKEIAETLTQLNKANGKFLDDTRNIKISDSEYKISNVIEDTKNYLNDFMKKAAKTTDNKNTFINKFHKKAKNTRNAANILAIAALSAFLYIIPKLYKTGDKFPGKDGLVKDEIGKSPEQKVETSKVDSMEAADESQ